MVSYKELRTCLALIPLGIIYVLSEPCDAETAAKLTAQMEGIRGMVNELTRHVMLLSHQDRERVMAEGTSGIVKVRDYTVGANNYHYASHFGHGFANIHDHSNHEKVYGLGDFVAVLNGVQFRTRHNDFELRKASTTSKEWLATEPIELPPLPEGLEDMPVPDQITELREYIRAFKEQNDTIRPYQEFFKPVLCYLEGWWALNTTGVENGFTSLRLQFNAKSWSDMADKARADAYLGSDFSLRHEDGSLPVTILSIDPETHNPIYAQWNYRVLCHPVERDIPTSVFKPIDDFAYRKIRGVMEEEDLYNYKGSRYVMDTNVQNIPEKSTILDSIVETIPGMDNIPEPMQEDSVNRKNTGNLGFYNRAYHSGKDALASTDQLRGYSDGNMFVAMTTQEEVAPLIVNQCVSRSKCYDSRIRATWMFPIEVLYLTPLQRWNPYNLEHFTNEWKDYAQGNDGKTESKAYTGTHERNYYRTPKELFDRSSPTDKVPEDTYGSERWIKNAEGYAHAMVASGPRVLLPNINGVGETRLRFPIAAVHEEGTGSWKELNGFIDYLADGFEAIASMEIEADED